MSEDKEYMRPFVDYFLEATYDPRHNEVVITANDVALRHLRDLISGLVETGTPGSHVHLDRLSGLEGNVSSLVIGKRPEK